MSKFDVCYSSHVRDGVPIPWLSDDVEISFGDLDRGGGLDLFNFVPSTLPLFLARVYAIDDMVEY